jgi:hypothetical protein
MRSRPINWDGAGFGVPELDQLVQHGVGLALVLCDVAHQVP